MKDANIDEINRIGEITMAWNNFTIKSDLQPDEITESILSLSVEKHAVSDQQQYNFTWNVTSINTESNKIYI